MKCTNCGKDLNDNAAFCSECGAPVNAQQASEATEPVVPAPTPEEATPVEIPEETAPAGVAPEETASAEVSEEVAPVGAPEEEIPTEGSADEVSAPVAAEGTEAVPVSETPKKKPLYKKPLFYIIIVLVLAILAGAACLLATKVFCNDEDDVSEAMENTVDALFSDNALFNHFNSYDEDKGSTYELFFNVGTTMTGMSKNISAQVSASELKGNSGLKLLFGSAADGKIDAEDETLFSVDAFTDKDGNVAIKSNLLGENTYGWKLDDTFFTKFSNSYIGKTFLSAMENGDEVLDFIKYLTDLANKGDSESPYEAFAKKIEETEKTYKGNYTSDGKEIAATVHEYRIDADTVTEFFNAVIPNSFTETDPEYDDDTSVIVKVFVKGKYVVRIEAAPEDEEGYLTVDFGTDPSQGSVLFSYSEQDGNSVEVTRTVEKSADKYTATYKTKTTENGTASEFNPDTELSFTHNKKDNEVALRIKTGSTDYGISGTLKTDNGIELEFKNISGMGFDLRLSAKNSAEPVSVPEYKDLLTLSEEDFLTIAQNILSDETLGEKMINVMGEDFAELLSWLFNGEYGYTEEESEDIAYYTSGEYGFFGCDYSPYGLTEEDLNGISAMLSDIIEETQDGSGEKDYSDMLSLYVKVYEGDLDGTDGYYHYEACYSDDSYSGDPLAYYGYVTDGNGYTIEIVYEADMTCNMLSVNLFDASTEEISLSLIYSGEGLFMYAEPYEI